MEDLRRGFFGMGCGVRMFLCVVLGVGRAWLEIGRLGRGFAFGKEGEGGRRRREKKAAARLLTCSKQNLSDSVINIISLLHPSKPQLVFSYFATASHRPHDRLVKSPYSLPTTTQIYSVRPFFFLAILEMKEVRACHSRYELFIYRSLYI